METYAIYEELFEQAKLAEDAFKNNFVSSYADLKTLYTEMSEDKNFNGLTQEGFIELFDILIQFHGDLNKELPDFYKEIKDFKKEMNDIPNTNIYKKLSED